MLTKTSRVFLDYQCRDQSPPLPVSLTIPCLRTRVQLWVSSCCPSVDLARNQKLVALRSSASREFLASWCCCFSRRILRSWGSAADATASSAATKGSVAIACRWSQSRGAMWRGKHFCNLSDDPCRRWCELLSSIYHFPVGCSTFRVICCEWRTEDGYCHWKRQRSYSQVSCLPRDGHFSLTCSYRFFCVECNGAKFDRVKLCKVRSGWNSVILHIYPLS